MNYIYGLHEPGGEDILRPGSWIVFTHELGHDPTNQTGHNYSAWKDYNLIARLNHGYYPVGTIPGQTFYADFAQRCANWVNASTGCHRWIIGNEPNHSQERPRNRVITPEMYVECFNQVAQAIHTLYGHELDEVIPAAIAPWNVESGDWLVYATQVWENCIGVGAICIHTYTHGADPAMIVSEQTMDAPYSDRRYNFRAYRDLLARVPFHLRGLPVYITETDQNDPWANVAGSEWIQRAYDEIDAWNNKSDAYQRIHCLCLYRWPKFDQWYIEGKNKVIADFQAAQAHGYSVDGEEPNMAEWYEVYANDCETFYDQDGIGELTIPGGTRIHWIHGGAAPNYPRPEADKKELPQPEVYRGQRSAGFFYVSSKGKAALVTDPIVVAPGKPVRATTMYMHVFNTAPEIGGGGRLGIVNGDGPFVGGPEWPIEGSDPFNDPSITWGEWQGTYGDGALPNREWAQLSVGPMTPTGGTIRLVLLGVADVAGKGSHFHWDMLRAEQYSEGSTPPVPPAGDGFESILDAVSAIEVQCATIRAEIATMQANVVLAYVVGTPS